jgi:hypothetical protein
MTDTICKACFNKIPFTNVLLIQKFYFRQRESGTQRKELKWTNLPLEESSDELNQELPCILHLPSLLLLPYWKHSYPVLAEEEEEEEAAAEVRFFAGCPRPTKLVFKMCLRIQL